ncbi:T4 RnlA family RNA ligase [Bacillus sp. CGMCC 1.16541]|uniref:T4 RnlA family RNA ligase n=1 Tax=Bacillus sp. CGMCC 1.16541 TaxID=2185143 RepID=UPI000D735891|nr:T4 RnlA family RNA ligase [Bacillus sp. CGMCC 1.16541]
MFEKDAYMFEVEQKYVTRREHPIYAHLVILNYTEHVTYEKRWNDVTLSCRGLILNEKSGEVIARPFPKFFNYGEYPEYEVDIPFHEVPEFTVKHDGSLGISYKVDGQVYWATRGSFESEQAKVAQHIWDSKYASVHIPDELTLLVEIIDPRTKVVVNYNGLSDLIMIGAVNRLTGYDYPYEELLQLGKQLGMAVTEQVKLTIEEAVKLKSEIDHNSEGWVLRWPNGKRLKVKGNHYIDIHKIAYGLSTKMKAEYWKENSMEELMIKMPEEFRQELEQFQMVLNEELEKLQKNVNDWLEKARKAGLDRKVVASYVASEVPKDLRYLLFKAYDQKLSDSQLREHIYKRYTEFVAL